MKKIVLAILSVVTFSAANAQVWVDTTNYTPQVMINDFFSSADVTVSNITYNGDTLSMAYFDGSATTLGLNTGLLLSTGNVFHQASANVSMVTTAFNAPGDADMDSLVIAYSQTPAPTYDAAVVEFDFVPNNDTIYFKYVFGSEEYTSYTCSYFNDGFAFLIEGPGYPVATNIAAIPGTNIPVMINSVNSGTASGGSPSGCLSLTNDSLFVDNIGGSVCEYDGLTVPLDALAVVTPGALYHAKVVVADTGDGVLDSGVFMSSASLGARPNLEPIANFVHNDNTNTVDFHDKSRYGTSWYWEFGDGQTSTDRHPQHTFADLSNQAYLVTLTVSNYCCSAQYTEVVGNINAGIFATTEKIADLVPNPAQSQIRILSHSGNNMQAEIFDLSGKLFFSGAVVNGQDLDISFLPTGIYQVRLIENGKTGIEKLIKQ